MESEEILITSLQSPYIEQTKTLMMRCFEQSLHSIFFLNPDTTLIALQGETVVAGLNMDVYQVNARVKMGYLGWLYTDPALRGRGLAGRLLSQALTFLMQLGCTDVAACVEGDNPASFKQLESRGFSPLSLSSQLLRFRFGTLHVYRHASRFFDMGYFLWHKRLDGSRNPPFPTNMQAFLSTLFANTLLASLLVFNLNLPALLKIHLPWIPAKPSFLLWAVPCISLSVRNAASFLAGKRMHAKLVYKGWDTAYITGLLVPLLFALPFPVPGNLYLAGSDWKLSEQEGVLTNMALASLLALALLFLFLPTPYTLLLILLDGLFFFYPFCGFNASRLRRGSRSVRLFSALVVLAACASLLVY